MQCAEIVDTGAPLKLVTRERPAAPPGGLLVKTSFAGVCHTDIHMIVDANEGFAKGRRDHLNLTNDYKGLVLGHEIAGVIEQIGSSVPTNSSLKVGDKVMVYPWRGCFKCDVCVGGDNMTCENNFLATTDIGMGQNPGGYSNYVSVPEWELAVKVPAKITMDVASMLPCSALTTFVALGKTMTAINRAVRLRQKANLLIIGAGGGLGSWCVTLAKMRFPDDSVRIICADVSDERLVHARELGADDTVVWKPDATVEELASTTTLSGHNKIDAAVDLVGITKTAETALACLYKGGTLILVGLAGGQINIPIPTLIGRCINVQGSRTGGLKDFKEMVEFLSKQTVKCPPVEYYKLEEVNEIVTKLVEGKVTGRALLKFVD